MLLCLKAVRIFSCFLIREWTTEAVSGTMPPRCDEDCFPHCGCIGHQRHTNRFVTDSWTYINVNANNRHHGHSVFHFSFAAGAIERGMCANNRWIVSKQFPQAIACRRMFCRKRKPQSISVVNWCKKNVVRKTRSTHSMRMALLANDGNTN